MPIRATPCVGYWAAHYVNRNGDWSIACDALGLHHPVRDRETSALGRALSPSSSPAVARGGPILARTEKRSGRGAAVTRIASRSGSSIRVG
jgi:hypothetical protein